MGVGRFVTNDCWKRGGVFYLFFKEGSVGVGVGVGRFVINDCWKRGGVFIYFLTDFDVIEWEKRSEWLLGVGVGVGSSLDAHNEP